MLDSELINIFLEEAEENLQAVEEGLLMLEQRPADRELINVLFRAMHTIKGGAGMAGFAQVGYLAHQLENILARIQQDGAGIGEKELNLFFSGTDLLRKLLKEQEHAGEEIVQQLAGLLAALEQEAAQHGPADPFIDPEEGMDLGAFVQDCDAAGLKAASDGGAAIYLVRVSLRPHCFKAIRAYMVLEATAAFGEIVKLTPPATVLEQESSGNSFAMLVVGGAGTAALQKIIAGISEVESVQLHAVAPAEALRLFAADELIELPTAEGVTAEGVTAASTPAAASKAAGSDTPAGTIRVDTAKLEKILDHVAELLIAQSRVKELALKNKGESRFAETALSNAFQEVDKIIRRMQEDVMDASMVPIGATFLRFQRLARDLGKELGKELEVVISGRETELDKKVIEQIADPLQHLIRNCVDHGLEKPAVRLAMGKPPQGIITLSAFHREGNIVIEIGDDGGGIDLEAVRAKAEEKGLIERGAPLSEEAVQQLLFMPGFSTAKEISGISGRGVGLDVVTNNIRKLRGSIELLSAKGQGTKFVIKLPLTLAIIDGMLIRVGQERLIIPLAAISEFIRARNGEVRQVEGKGQILSLRQECIPYTSLYRILGITPDFTEASAGTLVILQDGRKKMALLVDEIIGQEQVVIKSIKEHLEQVPGIAGATIMGDGRVTIILDITSLFRLARQETDHGRPAAIKCGGGDR